MFRSIPAKFRYPVGILIGLILLILSVQAVPAIKKLAGPAAGAELPLGQLLMVGFAGSVLDENHPILEDIRSRHLGGVILFNYGPSADHPAGNIVSPEQLRSLTAQLQKAAGTVPVLIAIDQEGGRIVRLKEEFGFPATVSAASLGKINDPALTRKRSDAIALSLQQVGINLNLGPVVDLNSNPDNPVIGKLERSFSADPAVVVIHAREYIRAHHRRGILCSLKHFPGHGSSTGDSHQGFVDVTASWSAKELDPFRTLIDENLADTVLTAHVFNATLDAGAPATLSKKTVDGLLRKHLGFSGVVLSDDLTMGAIADHYSLEETVEKALNAGVDMLLLADNHPDTTRRMLSILHKLIDSGRVSRQRIEQSLQRIAALKERLQARPTE
ncbi:MULTISPECIES: glycoside hydrolase family 3 protein [Syntrophotalea]|jgi:beta-N-acetylhexosaminidase|uniref:beta-N-acetylhexosaminidase n=1 Tax=Syntrophotalea acetylenica TaxID=29542 RepID=A0A1L3GI24_SYNAC|nr:glycoside hydrolase family 3 protein [Syntrophotalea acetylenica]APG25539.1 glycoside hydrolase family 3 [Syntrophotalea acetylenica]APG43606.1 glycoside hydrolase family 3 [Syntrophotalea acetylenica]